MGSFEEDSFHTAELIRQLTEAAIRNQRSISKSRKALDDAIAELANRTDTLAPALAKQVNDEIAGKIKSMLAEAAAAIAKDVSTHFTDANRQAERAYQNYKRAAEHNIWYTVTVASICSALVSLLIGLLVRR
jgi:ElaB/YqjD/DUF883 family membrane-anchored ribosome-binding protein